MRNGDTTMHPIVDIHAARHISYGCGEANCISVEKLPRSCPARQDVYMREIYRAMCISIGCLNMHVFLHMA